MAHDAVIFPDADHVRLRTPQARKIMNFFAASMSKSSAR
jgi:hypothetical protein